MYIRATPCSSVTLATKSRYETPKMTPSVMEAPKKARIVVRRKGSVFKLWAIKGFVGRTRRPGMKALTEIRELQRTTGLLIPKISFARLVRCHV